MAYKDDYMQQEQLTLEQFEKLIEEIEMIFTKEVTKSIRFKEIYVLLPGVFCQSYFVKTTVSDVMDVCGNININVLLKHYDTIGYAFELSIFEKATPKQMRGILRFTPKNTLAYSAYGIASKSGGQGSCVFCAGTHALLQDEKFLVSYCDNAYDNDENNVDYDYVEKRAFKVLDVDKRFSTNNQARNTNPERVMEMSQNTQRIISTYYEMTNSWAIIYDWNGLTFKFPMEQKYFKELLKNREKVNGRKRVLPTVVKKHKRKDREVSSHLRAADYDCILNGRKFDFLIGGEDFEKIFPENEYGKRKLSEIMRIIEK